MTKSELIARPANADLLVLEADLSIHSVIARGKTFVHGGAPARRGMFDDVLMRELG